MAIDNHEVINALRERGHSTRDAVAYVNEWLRARREADALRQTLRDEFAKEALAPIYTNLCRFLCEKGQTVENVYEIVAMAAYEQADAMLEARKPREGEPS